MTIRANARRAGLISALFACGMVFAADPAKHHVQVMAESKSVPADSIVLRGDHATTRLYEALVEA